MAVGDNVLCECKRKMTRKSKKKIKKFRHVAYNSHRKIEDIILEEESPILEEETDCRKEDTVEMVHTKKKQVKRRRKKSMKQLRKEQLMRDIDEDDVEIHRYERILGYNKRKSKNIPKVFRIEGLDYLLEMCDSKPSQSSDVDGGNFSDVCNSGMLSDKYDEDCSGNKDENRLSKTKIAKKKSPAPAEVQRDGFTEMGVSSGSEEDINMNSKEDIYGRLISKKTGEFLTSKLCGQEKLNEKAGLLETEEHLKLKKSLRGLINRMNEHTLVGAVKMFSDIFASRGHNEVKQLLFSEIMNSVDVSYRLPDRLIIEYTVFIALIHTTVSDEVSAHFVENYIAKLLETVTALPEGKSLENLCVLLAELYNFKVIKVVIIIEIMQYLREQVNDKCLTCFKALLSYCGNTMRSRDLDALRKCITETQAFFSRLPEKYSGKHQSRYIVDELNAIKNVNIRKFTDLIDSALYSHYVNIFRGLTKKLDKEKELPMSVDDIIHVRERGRWWLVGAAWFPTTTTVSKNKTTEKFAGQTVKFSSSLLQLAKKAKMNTTVRRDIFCTIMASTNETDAFEKLLKLSLRGQQEREIVHICVHCALREATYNAFYAAVIDLLCCYHKRFKLTTQYALWDRIKVLSRINESQREYLAMLIVDLMIKRSVGITLLKVIEFGAIDKITAEFVRSILSAVLVRSTEQALMDMFQNVVSSPQHKDFIEALQVFIHMALKKPQKDIDNKLLLSKIDFIESIWGNNPL